MNFNISQVVLPTDALSWFNPPVYANDLFVASCHDRDTSGVDYFITSPDGQAWTQRALPITCKPGRPVFGAGALVMLNEIGVTTTAGLRSTDGLTWSTVTLPAAAGWGPLAFGNGVFAAIKYNTTTAVTSPDGITWTQSTLPVTFPVRSMCFFNGLFFAFSTSTYLTSPDGVTWTQRTLDADIANLIYATMVGPDYLIVVPQQYDICYRSADGLTWEVLDLPTFKYWQGGCYGNGVFILASNSSPGVLLASSDNGATWEDISPVDHIAYLSGVGYAAELEAYVTFSGTAQSGLFIQALPSNFWTNFHNQREIV